MAAGLGPNANSGSPLDTNPASRYHGNVPIGPTVGTHAGVVAGGVGRHEGLRADHPVYVGCVHVVPPSREN